MEKKPSAIPIILVDMAGFSDLKTDDERAAILVRLYGALVASIKPLVGFANPGGIIRRHGVGDGYYLFLENFPTPVAMRIGFNLEEFLKTDNTNHSGYPLRLRVGLTLGQVGLAEDQILGSALIEAARLIDSVEIRNLLKKKKDDPLVLVASLFFWDNWNSHTQKSDPDLAPPVNRNWERRVLVVKGGKKMVAYVQADAKDFAPTVKKAKKASGSGTSGPKTSTGTKPKKPSPSSADSKRDIDRLFNELKKKIADILGRCPRVMEALELHLDPTSEPISDETAFRNEDVLTSRLVALEFKKAIEMLSTLHQGFLAAPDKESVHGIEAISRYLLPSRSASGMGMSVPERERLGGQVELGEVVFLPAGDPTLAALIMAGLDSREVVWDSTEQDFPVEADTSLPGSLLGQPEIGLSDGFQQNVQADMKKRVQIPSNARTVTNVEAAIREQYRSYFVESGYRHYYICEADPGNPADREIYDKRLDWLAETYPELAIVRLSEYSVDEQRLVNQIRNLVIRTTP
ncbi:MAG: hypothetical protein HQL75_01185 [Magnetococcales bacterium]|nr:hypothetical protein [Magnetococcales bacterium]